MKINSKSQLALRLRPEQMEKTFFLQYDSVISKAPDEKLKNEAIRYWLEMFAGEFPKGSKANALYDGEITFLANRNYLMSKSALELAQTINIDADKFDVRFLSKIKDKRITFLLGENLQSITERRTPGLLARYAQLFRAFARAQPIRLGIERRQDRMARSFFV